MAICEKALKPTVLTGNNPEDETMGNTQVTEGQLGWLAGIIDGEGCVVMAKAKRSWGYNYSPRVTITNTDEAIIQQVRDIYSVLGIRYYFGPPRTGGLGKRRIFDVIVTRLGDLAKLLELLIPHLVGDKRQKIELMHRFLTLRLSKSTLFKGRSKLTEEEISLAEGCRNPNDYTPKAA